MVALDARRGIRGGRPLRLLRSEGVAVATIAFLALVALLAIPQELVQDSWLALVAGREVVTSGIPETDSLNIWTNGVRWIDQQWLAQTALYGLFSVGGIRLTMLAHVALVGATLAAGVVAARRLGGSALSASLLAVATLLTAPWALQVRPQTAAMPLFVAVLWLLARDSRTPSRHVYIALPLLVLWANVHGTVVLAAALVVLRALTIAHESVAAGARPWTPKAAVLGVAPFACLLATPYGLSVVGYYEHLLFNPLLREYVVEWKRSTPSATTIAFYVHAAVAIWLIARHRRLLTRFEQAALVLTVGAGFLAVRSILWFALASLILLPRLVDATLPRLPELRGAASVRAGLAAGAVVALAVAAAAVGTADERWYVQEWPARAAERVAAVNRAGGGDVLSDERYADWLLWEQPELRGRVAYGARFELFDREQFASIAAYKRPGSEGWRRTAAGYEILVLDRRVRSTSAERKLASSGGYRVAFRDEKLTVLAKPRLR
jgi:hypothetical protein